MLSFFRVYNLNILILFFFAYLIFLFVCFRSGSRRATSTSRRASIGGRTSCAMSPSKTSTTGCGRRSLNGGWPISFTSKSSSPFETVRCSQDSRYRAKKRFHCCTTNLTWRPENHLLGNPTVTNPSVSQHYTMIEYTLKYTALKWLYFQKKM